MICMEYGEADRLINAWSGSLPKSGSKSLFRVRIHNLISVHVINNLKLSPRKAIMDHRESDRTDYLEKWSQSTTKVLPENIITSTLSLPRGLPLTSRVVWR